MRRLLSSEHGYFANIYTQRWVGGPKAVTGRAEGGTGIFCRHSFIVKKGPVFINVYYS